MKRNKKILFIGILAMLMIAFLSGQVISAEMVTISGTVNEDGQIVTADKAVYEIGDNDQGDKLVNLAGKKVEVKGTVGEEEGVKIITVDSYIIIEK